MLHVVRRTTPTHTPTPGVMRVNVAAFDLAQTPHAHSHRDAEAVSPSTKFVELLLLATAEQEYQHQGGVVREEGDCCPVCMRVHGSDTRGVGTGGEDDDAKPHDEYSTPQTPPAAIENAIRALAVPLPVPPQQARTSPAPPATKRVQLPTTAPTPGEIYAPTAGRGGAAVRAAGVVWYQLHCHTSHWVCGECFDEMTRYQSGRVTCPLCRHPAASYSRYSGGGRMRDSAAHVSGDQSAEGRMVEGMLAAVAG